MNKRSSAHWAGKRVALVGLGVSNVALARFLVAAGAEVHGFDAKERHRLPPAVAELENLGVQVYGGPDYLEAMAGPYDTVFLTPGVDRRQPGFQALRQQGVRLSSEIQLFFDLCPAPIIGITGSSGKTTTTTLIGEILRRGSRPVWVGGNIGNPLIEQVQHMEPDHWVVLELSSFQLEFLNRSPHVAVMTNFSPNHLDVHGSLDEYRDAKGRVFRFQSRGDWALFHADDPVASALARESRARLFPFSRRQKLSQGSYLAGDRFVVRGPDGQERVVAHRADLKIPGEHNVENALAAVAVGHLCGIDPEAMGDVLRSFRGVAHRLEEVATVDGVRYINDSIATSPARAAAGLRAFSQPIVLIAGGYDKKLPFDPLVEAIQTSPVRAVVLLGATADQIAAAVETLPEGRRPALHRVATLAHAVAKARELARPGDVVLLSPACASYDMFPNFEARGQAFRELVRALEPARPTLEGLVSSRAEG